MAAQTFVVAGRCFSPFPTISAALNHARHGSIVHVKADRYAEAVQIPAGVALTGESAETVTVEIDDRPGSCGSARSPL